VSDEENAHIHSITTVLEGKSRYLAALREKGCNTDIFCFWESSGQGGPSLDLETMKSLVELGLEIAWDIYFLESSELEKLNVSGAAGVT
jgi:hypothetical protein